MEISESEIQTKTEFKKKYLFKIYISFIKKYITKAWHFRRKIEISNMEIPNMENIKITKK